MIVDLSVERSLKRPFRQNLTATQKFELESDVHSLLSRLGTGTRWQVNLLTDPKSVKIDIIGLKSQFS